jgi:hypothetical protein
VEDKSENRVSTKTRGGSAARKSASSSRTSKSKSTSTTTLPDDVRRNTYTADREAGLYVRGLRTTPSS